jgi:hypothetical protein
VLVILGTTVGRYVVPMNEWTKYPRAILMVQYVHGMARFASLRQPRDSKPRLVLVSGGRISLASGAQTCWTANKIC